MNRRDRQAETERSRRRAVELGEAGDAAALPELNMLARHPQATVRRAAASALGKLAGVPGIDEDDVDNLGVTVAELLGDSVTDVDADAAEGIAVWAADPANGVWQVSLAGQRGWVNVDAGALSVQGALLLQAEDAIRLRPDTKNGTAATFEFCAWDRTTGTAGSTADVTQRGGTTPFSLADDTATITVDPANDAPTVANAIPDQETDEDAAFTFTAAGDAFADVDTGDALTLAASLDDGSPLPVWLTFTSGTRAFSGTPLNADVGAVFIKVTATDTAEASVSDTFALTVSNTNDAPVLDLDDGLAGLDYATTFVEGAGAVAVTGTETLALVDVDGDDILWASATLTNALDGDAERLSATVGSGAITAEYEVGTGVLSLQGVASVAEYADVLRTVSYENTREAPSPGDRTIEFAVSDGQVTSGTARAVVALRAAVVCAVAPGWNLLSLPFATDGSESPLEVLSADGRQALVVGPVWDWDAAEQGFARLHGGFRANGGCWVYSVSGGVTRRIQGEADAEGRVFLHHGWNAVGPTSTIAVRAVAGIRNLRGPIWRWNRATRTFEAVGIDGVLERGKAYWMYAPDPDGCWIDTRE